MGVLKRIKNIEEQITNFNNTTLKRAEKLDEQNDLLENIKLKVKKANVVQDANSGLFKLVIEYDIPKVEIRLDEDSNETQDLMVRSINLLGLISIDDQVMLSKKLNEAKEKNKFIWQK